MKNRNSAISIIGVIIVVFTGILFALLTEDRRTSMFICLGFIVGAEIVLFGGLLTIEYLSRTTSQIIVRTVCGITLGVGSIASILVSCIYMGRDVDSLRGFYSWQLIIWVLAIIGITIGFFTASSVKASDTRTMNTVMTLTLVTDQLTSLSDDSRNTKYADQLKKIADELCYSDTSSLVPSDELIQNAVAKLEVVLVQEYGEDEKDTEIKNLLSEILVLINKRKQEVKLTKVGGI
ncbi:hypothetical protein SAMN02746066_01220 [Anaerosporobacter mobilis DSM 15930]|jgi:hypothetical protein|uniref:Uncharacterized protein n=1 Tax=Anaerosporobacter mobilis DSM 15930 TaxID=1120996 RepID=A0A1M7H0S1_9FIRM|nr:hypothetical protein [Anaerosporobacter mobilis]SHM21963.1 hypothetical protein SAMN02746066_01220 [Anaerosporobacter mobilis DSM 15930]